jgi:signal transduction histidine kinase/ActR/RegA family two-component response regulator
MAGGGETGALIRAHDWMTTPLGRPDDWPQALKSLLSTMLSSPQPLFLAWGPELTFLFNDAYGECLGLRRGEAVGRPFSKLWSEIWSSIEPIVRKALNGEGSQFENFPLTVARNGYPEDTWWTFSYMPIHDQIGKICGMLGIVTETTKHVVAQEALRVSEAAQAFRVELGEALRNAVGPKDLIATAAEKLGRYLHASCVGYAHVELGGEFIVIDHEWTASNAPSIVGTRKLIDYGPAMAIGLQAGRTIRVDDTLTSPVTMDAHALAYAAMGTRAFINVPLGKDRQLAASLFVLHPEPRVWTDGEVAAIEEVADRSWASLLRLQTEETLRQSQKMEAIGQLTGGLAHDFNNMLQAIISGITLAQKRVSAGRSEDAARLLDAAREAASRATALTQRLLAFGRRQALNPKPIDPGHLIRGIESLLQQTIGPEIEFLLKLRDPCWPIRCDANQLENALLNLVINARDSMLPAGGQLIIETSHVSLGTEETRNWEGSEPGEYVRITVSDTGSGMASNVLTHVFEPFFTTKPDGQGTGLGLSQLYGFVRQLHGIVRIESRVGSGTSVHMFLARCHNLPNHEAFLRVAETNPERWGSVTGATVLLVEDEDDIRAFAAEALRELGYRVLEAGDGPQGLKILRGLLDQTEALGIDLLITDVGLPGGLNGRQLADAIRELVPGLPILLITGYAGNAFNGKGQLASGMELLSKPFELDVFTRRVKSIVEAKSLSIV